MTASSIVSTLKQRLQFELKQLTTIRSSNRPWQLALAAALASGLPCLIGAHFKQLQLGVLATMGGLVILYLPNTRLSRRMVMLMACAFVFSACYALGSLSHFVPGLMVPILIFITMVVTMLCRFYETPPPGSLFFVLVAAVAAYTPHQLAQVPLLVGALTLGCLLAVLIGFFYSLYTVAVHPPPPEAMPAEPSFDYVVVDSVLIGLFVGLALLLAELFKLDKPYWVPVSCLAVSQGNSLRAVWDRQIHRIIGTALGLLVAGGLTLVHLSEVGIALVIMGLMMVTEVVIVRHYAVAVTFVTPLTILLAEAATLGQSAPAQLMRARFIDTLLGCLVGFMCGVCMHNQRVRGACSRVLRRLVRMSAAN